MGLRAYKLSPAYEGTLVGGIIRSGADSEIDIKKELEKGNGEILTADPMLQGVLQNYHGAEGLVFAESEADGDERTPVITAAAAHVIDESKMPQQAPFNSTGSVPDAEHDENVSEYFHFTMDELRDTLNERGIQFTQDATEESMIQALENDDLIRQEGNSNGS